MSTKLLKFLELTLQAVIEGIVIAVILIIALKIYGVA